MIECNYLQYSVCESLCINLPYMSSIRFCTCSINFMSCLAVHIIRGHTQIDDLLYYFSKLYRPSCAIMWQQLLFVGLFSSTSFFSSFQVSFIPRERIVTSLSMSSLCNLAVSPPTAAAAALAATCPDFQWMQSLLVSPCLHCAIWLSHYQWLLQLHWLLMPRLAVDVVIFRELSSQKFNSFFSFFMIISYVEACPSTILLLVHT